jgi:hypothetical protein
MSQNVSKFLLNRLSEWGIKRIFGFPGLTTQVFNLFFAAFSPSISLANSPTLATLLANSLAIARSN